MITTRQKLTRYSGSLAVVLGVIVSMLFYERLHLTTGGAIVPGYLAVFLPQPLFIGVTLLATVCLA